MNRFTCILFFVFLNLNFAQAQCPNPKDLVKSFSDHVKAQRNILVSAKSHVLYRSLGGNNISSAEYERRFTASDGKMTYTQLSENKVSRVIRMGVERDSTLSIDDRRRIEFSDENYSFEYLPDEPSSKVIRFKLIPVENREGLVRGEIWFDKMSCLPLRVFGHVQQHHMLVKLMDVDEDMQFVNGIMLPHVMSLKYRVFAIVRTISGTIETTNTYSPEDVVVDTTLLRASNQK